MESHTGFFRSSRHVPCGASNGASTQIFSSKKLVGDEDEGSSYCLNPYVILRGIV